MWLNLQGLLLFFLLSQHKDKGCHNQSIPADLYSLYTVVTCITFMLIYWRCLHTPRNIFFKCQSAKAGVTPWRSICVLARVFAHWQFRARSSVSWSPSKITFCKTSISPPLKSVTVGTFGLDFFQYLSHFCSFVWIQELQTKGTLGWSK